MTTNHISTRRDSLRSAGIGSAGPLLGWPKPGLSALGATETLLRGFAPDSMRFANVTGTYAYRCHMLEHTADGWMRDWRVMA
ncbi:MAG TPA: hypothetical protein VF292_10075 [Rhodanobacteraceae bacterium]